MAGHSHWSTIKRQKAKEDKKRGKIFSKIVKEITIATREGRGGDPNTNFKLRLTLEHAKNANMPKDTIKDAIKRGMGEIKEGQIEEFFYEGYGPNGIALYISIATDNRNRAAAEIRHILDQQGGNLGEVGCVSWLFKQKGALYLNLQGQPEDEDSIMLKAIDAGAEDIIKDKNKLEIITSVKNLGNVKKKLERANLKIEHTEITQIPNNEIEIDDLTTAEEIISLLDALEDNENVQQVFSNFNIQNDLLTKLSTTN